MSPSSMPSRPPETGAGLTSAGRRAWASLETLHVVGYFTEEPKDEYVALGLHRTLAYFATRVAAMGPVGPRVSEATFYVFAPWLHDKALPRAWETTTPEQLVRARREGVRRALDRIIGDSAEGPVSEGPVSESPVSEGGVSEALAIAREVCAGLGPAGRPLFAAHAALDWPDDELLALWHAATLVREHRGDGHVAVLTAHGLDPVEATVLDVAWSDRPEFLLPSRGWSDEEYAAAAARLVTRGWLDADRRLTATGRAERQRLEDLTEAASIGGWERVGEDATVRLAELLDPLRRAVLAAGILPGEVAAALDRAATGR